jgi:hypothetical protein
VTSDNYLGRNSFGFEARGPGSCRRRSLPLRGVSPERHTRDGHAPIRCLQPSNEQLDNALVGRKFAAEGASRRPRISAVRRQHTAAADSRRAACQPTDVVSGFNASSIKGLANLTDEAIGQKWLLQKPAIGVTRGLIDERLVRVPGHVQHAQPRSAEVSKTATNSPGPLLAAFGRDCIGLFGVNC